MAIGIMWVECDWLFWLVASLPNTKGYTLSRIALCNGYEGVVAGSRDRWYVELASRGIQKGP